MKKSIKISFIVLLSLLVLYFATDVVFRIVVRNSLSKHIIEDSEIQQSYTEGKYSTDIKSFDYLKNDNLQVSYWNLPGFAYTGATIYSGYALIDNSDLSKIQSAVAKALEWERTAKSEKVSVYKQIEIGDIYTEFIASTAKNGRYENEVTDEKSKNYNGIMKVYFCALDSGKQCSIQFKAYAKNKKQVIQSIEFNNIEELSNFLNDENIKKLESINKKEQESKEIQKQKYQEQLENDKAAEVLFN